MKKAKLGLLATAFLFLIGCNKKGDPIVQIVGIKGTEHNEKFLTANHGILNADPLFWNMVKNGSYKQPFTAYLRINGNDTLVFGPGPQVPPSE